jgi:hypothetical protein
VWSTAKDKDLSLDEQNAMTTMFSGMAASGQTALSVLAVGPSSRQAWLTSPNTQAFEVLSLPATEFPKRWIDYTCLDVVSLSRAELQLVAQSNPDALAALRYWVEAGGQVWISDAGKNWEQLPEVAKAFGVPATILGMAEDGARDTENDAEEDTAADELPAVAWRPVRFGSDGPLGRVVTFLDLTTGTTRVARDQATIDQLQNDPNYAVTNQEFQPEPEGPQRRWPSDSDQWFVDQRLPEIPRVPRRSNLDPVFAWCGRCRQRRSERRRRRCEPIAICAVDGIGGDASLGLAPWHDAG